MKKTLLPLTCVLLLGPLCSMATVAQDVSVQPLDGPLHLLQGEGGNVVASVGADGVLLVDDDYARLASAYETALQGLAGTAAAPRFVVNTHWHGDHAGANEHWGNSGAVIMAHSNVRKRMASPQMSPITGKIKQASPAAALPIVTFGDSLVLHFNGLDVEVQHYPAGHTDGDSVVFFPALNIVHMGDLFFKDRFPFVDLGSGGNVLSYIANVENVLAKIDAQTQIVPGHGSLANKKDLQRFLAMLRETSAAISSALEDGKTLQQIIDTGLSDKWASWGGGFINEASWIKIVAASLAKPNS